MACSDLRFWFVQGPTLAYNEVESRIISASLLLISPCRVSREWRPARASPFQRQVMEADGRCLRKTRGVAMANVEKLLHGSSEGVDLLTKLDLLPTEEK